MTARMKFVALLRNPSGVIGVSLVALLLTLCAASFLISFDPVDDVDPTRTWASPSAEHWLGTDRLGRDIFHMIVLGSRVTVGIAFGAAAVALVGGTALAALIVALRSPISDLLERITDIWVAFPTLIIALIVVTAFGGSTASSLIAIGVGSIPIVARTLIPELRRASRADYTLLAIASGARLPRLIWFHILPAVVPTLIVRITQLMGLAALAEAGLSYLGLGTPLPMPSWGRMLAEFQQHLYSHPGAVWVPATAITLAILGFNLLGDGLRDVLDPRWEGFRG